ncbi:MAG: hypothetical protein J2P16_00095 [Mycobacterium sp.]|nr:hypothetical protein [Mycobacterium sp.]
MKLSLLTEQFGADDQRWIGSADGTDSANTGTLVATSAEVGTVIPSGTVIGTDGSINGDDVGGFLLIPIRIDRGEGDYKVPVMVDGQVIDSRRVAKGLPALSAAQILSIRKKLTIVLRDIEAEPPDPWEE